MSFILKVLRADVREYTEGDPTKTTRFEITVKLANTLVLYYIKHSLKVF